jgi:hypothetical protein
MRLFVNIRHERTQRDVARWRLLGYAPSTPRNDQPTVTALFEYPRLECRSIDFAACLGFTGCDRNAGRPCSRSVDVNDVRISLEKPRTGSKPVTGFTARRGIWIVVAMRGGFACCCARDIIRKVISRAHSSFVPQPDQT